MRRRARDAHDAAMTNTTPTADTANFAGGERVAKRPPVRGWVGRSIAVAAVAGALGAGTVAYGFGSSPGVSGRVAISDGSSNT